LQVSVRVPQLPQAAVRVAFGAQAPWPPQEPATHLQLALQVSTSVPQLPQASVRVAFGAQAPWPVQVPVAHWQLALQVSRRVPQLPQATVRVAEGVHAPGNWVQLHCPLLQARPWGQTMPQPPQLALSVSKEVSQPVAGLESQSAKPGAQLPMAQWPALQVGVPFGVVQAMPQAPQWLTSRWASTSQPSTALLLQSR
jgi:hypothetical protein